MTKIHELYNFERTFNDLASLGLAVEVLGLVLESGFSDVVDSQNIYRDKVK